MEKITFCEIVNIFLIFERNNQTKTSYLEKKIILNELDLEKFQHLKQEKVKIITTQLLSF